MKSVLIVVSALVLMLVSINDSDVLRLSQEASSVVEAYDPPPSPPGNPDPPPPLPPDPFKKA